MHINELPNEILFQILLEVAKLNEQNGVTFTFGLSQPPMPPGQTMKRPQRYVRGPVPPALLRMDSTQSVRCVCSKWHDWAMAYALKDIYIRCWRGSERWCDISLRRGKLIRSPCPLSLGLRQTTWRILDLQIFGPLATYP
jgi:hypothetical protein